MSKGKDPALLWYMNDWYSGTILMSRFLKGCYMDLLHAQFNHGRLSLEEIKTCLGADFGSSWPTLQKKFKQDEQGLFFNERLECELTKRKKYTESRRANLARANIDHMNPHMRPHMNSHMRKHMENENENESTGTGISTCTSTSTSTKIENKKISFENGKLVVSTELLEEFYAEFGRENVNNRIPEMERWLKFNKPKKDYKRFIFNWLNKGDKFDGSYSANNKHIIVKKSGSGGSTTINDSRRTFEETPIRRGE